jgi:hypothetical protein
LHQTTLLERENYKKQEKKELKESEALLEQSKLTRTFVKYTKGLKHQVHRQKGEDYRVHGVGGWFWVSRTRSKKTQDMRTVGLRAGPVKCLIHGASGKLPETFSLYFLSFRFVCSVTAIKFKPMLCLLQVSKNVYHSNSSSIFKLDGSFMANLVSIFFV